MIFLNQWNIPSNFEIQYQVLQIKDSNRNLSDSYQFEHWRGINPKNIENIAVRWTLLKHFEMRFTSAFPIQTFSANYFFLSVIVKFWLMLVGQILQPRQQWRDHFADDVVRLK